MEKKTHTQTQIQHHNVIQEQSHTIAYLYQRILNLVSNKMLADLVLPCSRGHVNKHIIQPNSAVARDTNCTPHLEEESIILVQTQRF